MQETARQKESDMLMKIAGQEERKKVAAEEGRKRRNEEDEIAILKEEEVVVINNYVSTITMIFFSEHSQRKPTISIASSFGSRSVPWLGVGLSMPPPS